MNRVTQAVFGVLVAVVVGMWLAAKVDAHHAFAAEFDATRPIKLTGTIVKVEWVNPHSWFHIEVKKPNGEVERWMFEGGAPNGLVRRGFTKDYEGLRPGAELTIEGYLSKGMARRANARTMTFRDGRTLFAGSSGTGAPQDGRDPEEGR